MTQQQKILQLLQEAGPKGVSSFGQARQIALQLPRVMNDLKKAGYMWTTRGYMDGHVDYILLSSPVVKKAEAPKTDYSNYVFKDGRAYVPEEPRQESFI